MTPSLHIDDKHTTVKQYHNDPRDFGLSKRLTNLAALRQVGFTANRRLLGVQRISHDPIRGAQAFPDLTTPIITAPAPASDYGWETPRARTAAGPAHPPAPAQRVHQP